MQFDADKLPTNEQLRALPTIDLKRMFEFSVRQLGENVISFNEIDDYKNTCLAEIEKRQSCKDGDHSDKRVDKDRSDDEYQSSDDEDQSDEDQSLDNKYTPANKMHPVQDFSFISEKQLEDSFNASVKQLGKLLRKFENTNKFKDMCFLEFENRGEMICDDEEDDL
jgi:hypothetical protein